MIARLLGDRGLQAQVLAAAAVACSSLATLVILARLLGPDAYGVFGLVTASASLALIIQDGGYRILLFRARASSNPLPGELAAGMSAAMGWSLIATCVLLVAAAGLLIGDRLLAIAVAVTFIECLGKAWSGFAASAIRARGAFAREARIQATRQAAIAVAAISAAILSADVIVILCTMAIARFLMLALPGERYELTAPKPALPAWWLMMVGVLTVAYVRIDLLILGSILGPNAEVGIYSAISRLIDLQVFALSPLAAVFFRTVRLHPSTVPPRAITRLCLVLALPGLAILMMSLAAGQEILSFVFGASFASGAHYLWLVAGAMIVLPANFLIGQILLARDRERSMVVMTLLALVLKTAIVVTWAPVHGAMACAAAVLATEVFMLAYGVLALRQRDIS